MPDVDGEPEEATFELPTSRNVEPGGSLAGAARVYLQGAS